MADRNRVLILTAAFILFLGGATVFPSAGQTADRVSVVWGIVGGVDGNVISVEGKTYDLEGVPVRSADGSGLVEVSSLRGKTVEIVFRNRKIYAVTVYRTLPQ